MDGTFNNGSLGLYLIAGAIILFVLIQSIFFLVKAWKQGKKLGLDKTKLRNAVTSSALFTIPSALSVLATVIALATALEGTLIYVLAKDILFNALRIKIQLASVTGMIFSIISAIRLVFVTTPSSAFSLPRYINS